MKIIDKVKFTNEYFKKNLNLKDLCEKLPYTEYIIASLVFAVAFDQSIPEQTSDYIDDQYTEIIKRVEQRKNRKFYDSLEKMHKNGTLLPYFSKNFKLIYRYNFLNFIPSLVYSKINKSYYYINIMYQWKYLKNGTKNLVHNYENVPKVFKKKLTPRQFFNEILDEEKKYRSKEDFEYLIKNYHFETTDGINLWKLYSEKKGIMAK